MSTEAAEKKVPLLARVPLSQDKYVRETAVEQDRSISYVLRQAISLHERVHQLQKGS
jgi:hypothetical protein